MGNVGNGYGLSSSFTAAALLTCVACAQTPLEAPHVPTRAGATLGVLSYNLNYGIAGDAATLEAIAGQPSDLVLLQETTPEWEEALRARLAGEFAYMTFRHRSGAGGLGVLSKYPVQELEYIEPPEGGWFPGWRLNVQSPLGELQVLNVHLRPQLGDSGASVGGVLSGMVTTPPIRKEQIQLYASHLETGTPVLIAGDFNESEHGSAISWLEGRGLHSALPDFSHEDTWSWNTSLGRVSRRFDHIVTSRELRVLSARVIDAGHSDHRPVFALLELGAGTRKRAQ
jgi:endonuclease/exonuclease/phosphatase (EEP) superfamily protein YafD